MSSVADDVWKALADPTRRKLIELLSEQVRTTGELSEMFPSVSRFAVMKHLDVLEDAGLISVKREGRLRYNELQRDPLRTADEWLARHVEKRRDMLMRLKRAAEENGE